MDTKIERTTGSHLVWLRRLESYSINPIYFKDCFTPEMRNVIRVDVGRYS